MKNSHFFFPFFFLFLKADFRTSPSKSSLQWVKKKKRLITPYKYQQRFYGVTGSIVLVLILQQTHNLINMFTYQTLPWSTDLGPPSHKEHNKLPQLHSFRWKQVTSRVSGLRYVYISAVCGVVYVHTLSSCKLQANTTYFIPLGNREKVISFSHVCHRFLHHSQRHRSQLSWCQSFCQTTCMQ